VNLKTVAGFALPASSFAYIGDPCDPSSWKLPINFPGDRQRTINHIKNALHRFAEVKGIDERELPAVWRRIVAAARCYGISVSGVRPEPIQQSLAEPAKAPGSVANQSEKPPQQKASLSRELTALADRRAEEFLKSFGYE
jgi:hypothetical protein